MGMGTLQQQQQQQGELEAHSYKTLSREVIVMFSDSPAMTTLIKSRQPAPTSAAVTSRACHT